MPSYAHEVRNELARIFDEDSDCLRAELTALLRLGSVAVDGRRDFISSNAAVARKVIKLLKKIFPDARTEVAAVRRKKLRKTMRYVVRIFETGQTKNFFNNLTSAEPVSRGRCKISYLRGAFLASGSVNRPESNYRVEIFSRLEKESLFVKKILTRLDFSPYIYERGEDFVVLMREADSVCDFLGMVGAQNAVERFEIARNIKEVRLQVNRIVNCDTANLNRAVNTAQKQLADILLLKSNKIKVDELLSEAMEIRLKNPDCSVGELAKKIFITREGLVHRFKLIRQKADEIRTRQEKNFP